MPSKPAATPREIMARIASGSRRLQARLARWLAGDRRDELMRKRLTGPLAAIAPDIGALIEHCRTHASPVYLGDNTALCRSLGLFKLFVDTRDRGFAANLLLDGGWELWATIFIAGRVRPGM